MKSLWDFVRIVKIFGSVGAVCDHELVIAFVLAFFGDIVQQNSPSIF